MDESTFPLKDCLLSVVVRPTVCVFKWFHTNSSGFRSGEYGGRKNNRGAVDLIDQGGAPINTGLPCKPHIRRDCVPTTVPHSGRESSRRAAPLFKTMRRHQAGQRRRPPWIRVPGPSCGSRAQSLGRVNISRGLHDRAPRDNALGREPPQGDQQLPCQRHNHHLAHPAICAADALTEPTDLSRVWLISCRCPVRVQCRHCCRE
jgi:hypothetical protein